MAKSARTSGSYRKKKFIERQKKRNREERSVDLPKGRKFDRSRRRYQKHIEGTKQKTVEEFKNLHSFRYLIPFRWTVEEMRIRLNPYAANRACMARGLIKFRRDTPKKEMRDLFESRLTALRNDLTLEFFSIWLRRRLYHCNRRDQIIDEIVAHLFSFNEYCHRKMFVHLKHNFIVYALRRSCNVIKA